MGDDAMDSYEDDHGSDDAKNVNIDLQHPFGKSWPGAGDVDDIGNDLTGQSSEWAELEYNAWTSGSRSESEESETSEISPAFAEEIARFEDSFQGITSQYKIINRIGEG
jgi:hypothetical protein